MLGYYLYNTKSKLKWIGIGVWELSGLFVMYLSFVYLNPVVILSILTFFMFLVLFIRAKR